MATILDISTLTTEIVLTPRVVSTEFKIVEIHENVKNKVVRVDIELGPFVEEQRGPNGEIETRPSGRRGVTVWQGAAYDAVRDTWRNEDLMAKVAAILQASPQ